MSPTDTPLPPAVTPELAPPKTSGPLTTAADYVQGARMFDAERALEHIEYLACDEPGGRSPGTPLGRQTLTRTYSIPLQKLPSSRDLFGLQNGQRELYVTAV